MKKFLYIVVVIAFSTIFIINIFATNPLNKSQKSFYLETNHLLFMPALTFDYSKIIDKKYGYSISGGFSTIDQKKGYIVPPNIGFPINSSFLYGNRNSFFEIGATIRPQVFFTKDYVHHNHSNFEEKLIANSNLVYFTPRIGYRFQDKRKLSFKVSVGPQFNIASSHYTEYTGRIFDNYE
jgi:hypothetical protein